MDLSTLSDEEILAAAGISGQEETFDLSSLSDEEVLSAAGMEMRQPTWGESAAFVGKSLAGGAAKTIDLAGNAVRLNPMNPMGAYNALMDIFSGGYERPVQRAVESVVGTPEDTGIVGDVPRYAKAALEATAFPGSPLLNAAAGLGGEAGGLPGAVAAVVVPGMAKRAVTGGVSGLMDIFSTAGRKAAAADEAVNVVKKLGNTEEALQGLKAARELQESLPAIQRGAASNLEPFKRTAEITQLPGFAALEKQVANTVPEAKVAMAADDIAREQARQGIVTSLDKFPKSPEAVGQTIREGLEENAAALSEKISKEAERAFVGGENLKTFPAKKAVSDAIIEFTGSGAREVAPDFMKIVDNFRNLPARVDFKVLQDYRSAFGEYAGAAPVDTITKQTAKIAGSLRSAIDRTVERAIESGELSKAQGNAWKNMRTLTAKRGELYGSGVAGDVLEKAPFSSAENPRFAMGASEVGQKALSSVEDARQIISGLKGQPDGINAARSSLLSRIWGAAYNKNTERINPTTFNNQLKVLRGIDDEVLSPSQIRALQKVSDDFASETTTRNMATMASRGQTSTTEQRAMIDLVQDAVKTGSTGTLRTLLKKVPIIGDAIDGLISVVNDPIARQNLINQELARFVMEPAYAEAMLSKSPEVAESALKAFAERITAAVPSSIQAAVKSSDEEEPDIFTKMPMEKSGKKSKEEVIKEIDADPVDSTIFEIESGRGKYLENPKSSAKGPFQLIKATAEALGVEDPMDFEQNYEGYKKLKAQNIARFGDNPEDIYAAHFLGATLFAKWMRGDPLSPRDQKIVDELESIVLPRFRKIYAKKVENV